MVLVHSPQMRDYLGDYQGYHPVVEEGRVASFCTRRPCLRAADGGSYSHKNTSQLEKAQDRMDFPNYQANRPSQITTYCLPERPTEAGEAHKRDLWSWFSPSFILFWGLNSSS